VFRKLKWKEKAKRQIKYVTCDRMGNVNGHPKFIEWDPVAQKSVPAAVGVVLFIPPRELPTRCSHPSPSLFSSLLTMPQQTNIIIKINKKTHS